MRVSDNTNYGVIRDSINRSRTRMEDLQMKNATLKKVNKPSDDPVGSAKILEVRTDKVNHEQFLNNGKLAETYLNNTDHALEDLSEIVLRAKEIAINQSSAASSTQETRIAVAEEVKQLFERAVATANRRIADRYIFGGYQTGKPPVDADGKYHGDSGEMMIEIAREVYIGMNVPGVDAFNTNPNASGDLNRVKQVERRLAGETSPDKNKARIESETASEQEVPNVNLFEELKALRIGLLTGDVHSVRSTLDRFDELHGKVVSTRAKVGSRVQGIQSTLTSMDRHSITNAQLTSALEDADMTQVVSDLAKEETIFKSSLASSRHLLQPTLLDFLK